MKIQVLISCMNEPDTSIIERSNIQSDVVVVNQCYEESTKRFVFRNKKNELCTALFINTKERGLSRSRNMAIKNAWADVCVICDDDEYFFDNYVDIILRAYAEHPDCDIIPMLVIRNPEKKLPKGKLNWLSALKVSSVNITFKLSKIQQYNIQFDPSLGSGASKAGGEENKFLYECLKKKLIGYIDPIPFAKLLGSESQWFKGYNKDYFLDRGIMTRKLMGYIPAYVYALYFLLKKRKKYSKDISFHKALKYLIKGINT